MTMVGIASASIAPMRLLLACTTYCAHLSVEGVDSDKADAVMKTLIGKQVGSRVLRGRHSNCASSLH